MEDMLWNKFSRNYQKKSCKTRRLAKSWEHFTTKQRVKYKVIQKQLHIHGRTHVHVAALNFKAFKFIFDNIEGKNPLIEFFQSPLDLVILFDCQQMKDYIISRN